MFYPALIKFILTLLIGHCQQAPLEMEQLPPMTMTYFNNSLGSFIEHRGRASVIMSEWNILVYYNLKPLLTFIPKLRAYYETLKKHCLPGCPRSLELELHLELMEIENFRSNYGLSGELDATVARIQANEVDFKDLLKNQTSVVDSTTNVMTETDNLYELDEPSRLDISSSLFAQLNDQLRAEVGRVKRTQDAIRDAVFIAQQTGKLQAGILSAEQLQHELTSMLAHMPQERRLPFDSRAIADVYRVARVSHIQQLDKHLLFHIKLPLVDAEQFDVYHLTPIPRVEQSDIQLLYTETPNLAISDHLDRYFPLQNDELDSCLELHPQRFLCKSQQITFGRDSGSLPCTLAAFRNSSQSELCSLGLVKQNSLWLPLAAANRWMVAVTKELSIMAVCSADRQQLRIHGSGLLTIRSDCIVRSTSVMLQGMQKGSGSGARSYASLTAEELVEESSAVSIVAAVCLLLLLIVCVSLGWYYFHQRRVRAAPVAEPQTKREVRSNDQPLLEKPIGELPI